MDSNFDNDVINDTFVVQNDGAEKAANIRLIHEVLDKKWQTSRDVRDDSPYVSLQESLQSRAKTICVSYYDPILGGSQKTKEVHVTSPEAFQRVNIDEDSIPRGEAAIACVKLLEAIELRKKHYVSKKPDYYWGSYPQTPRTFADTAETTPVDTSNSSSCEVLNKENTERKNVSVEPLYIPFHDSPVKPLKCSFKFIDGVAHVFQAVDSDNGEFSKENIYPVPGVTEYFLDYHRLVSIVNDPVVRSYCYGRLKLLEKKFNLHAQLNTGRELQEQKSVPHRDFYNVRKVDTHVHHSACMNQKHLLRFIKYKLKAEPNEVCCVRDNVKMTLKQVFESLRLTAYDLSIDTLDMHADLTVEHRFDRFNNKYSPIGASRLREIFLKTDNLIEGRYLSELTKEVFNDLEASKYQLAEYRLSIYGRSRDEWGKLARWVVNNKLWCPQVRWMIQIPRLYESLRSNGSISSFETMITNIFEPLFEVTLNPDIDPTLHQFLGMIVGFDSVDDESQPDRFRDVALPLPAEWTGPHQPPYHYWTYYISANLAVLNRLRTAHNMTMFSFRPHSGEAGDADHLAATFLTAESINHGINLRRLPVLQYLYYLTQIGIAMSPLSNNRLFLPYTRSPFYQFFSCGMNVSLSTDDPLMLSYTKEPLLEEYAVATQVWRLSSTDMCEIARNSVLQSGFEYPFKRHFVGDYYATPGPMGNDIHYTNVPHIRLQFRLETMEQEWKQLDAVKGVKLDDRGRLPVNSDFHNTESRSQNKTSPLREKGSTKI